MKNFELVKILKDGESWISGDEMLKRAKELGITSGKKEADYLLEHQEEISEEWQSYYLIFPKYILLDDRRRRRVAFFYWLGRRWARGFDYLDGDFRVRGRFVRPRELPLETLTLENKIIEIDNVKYKLTKYEK